jgi:hypothetical protein
MERRMTASAELAAQRFRWDVKTLKDPAAADVDPTPLWTYVRTLRRVPAPNTEPDGDRPRIRPWELRTFIVPVRMLRARSKGDGDIHLVVADLEEERSTMVVELPSAPVGRRGHSIRCTRKLFECRFGVPPFSPRWLELEGHRATVYGVGFFDKPHAAFGAPNGMEVHPVIALGLATHPSDGDRPDELAELL